MKADIAPVDCSALVETVEIKHTSYPDKNSIFPESHHILNFVHHKSPGVHRITSTAGNRQFKFSVGAHILRISFFSQRVVYLLPAPHACQS